MIQLLVKNQRAASLGILLMALVAMTFVALSPHVSARFASGEIEANRTALLSLKGMSGTEDDLTRENTKLQASTEHLRLLLSGATVGIAGAELQQYLLARLARYNGRPLSVQVQPPVEDEDLARISISLVFQINIKGLRDLLLNLETGTPLLFVDSLSMQPINRDEPEGSRSRMLDVTMQISGFFPGIGTS